MKRRKSVNPYFAISVPIELKARIKKYAMANNTFIAEVVSEAVQQFFERIDNNEAGDTDQKRDTV